MNQNPEFKNRIFVFRSGDKVIGYIQGIKKGLRDFTENFIALVYFSSDYRGFRVPFFIAEALQKMMDFFGEKSFLIDVMEDKPELVNFYRKFADKNGYGFQELEGAKVIRIVEALEDSPTVRVKTFRVSPES